MINDVFVTVIMLVLFQNFIEKVENLLEAPEVTKKITEEAFNYISNKHSVANEENAYFSLLTKYC
jgi:hypothetical protein